VGSGGGRLEWRSATREETTRRVLRFSGSERRGPGWEALLHTMQEGGEVMRSGARCISASDGAA
jgi:hypothetical protein